MGQSNKKIVENLKSDYFAIVKDGLKIQRKGDIKAYTTNAIKAEAIAQKIQAISRKQ